MSGVELASSTMMTTEKSNIDVMHPDIDTLAGCYAADGAFLQMVAFCTSQFCQQTPIWKLERWWQANVVGPAAVQPASPGFVSAGARTNQPPPNQTFNASASLFSAMLVADVNWSSTCNAKSKLGTRKSLTSVSGEWSQMTPNEQRFTPLY